MEQYEDMLKQCSQLRRRIQELKQKSVGPNDESIRQIQLEFLSNRLTEVGRQIKRANIYTEREE